MGILLEYTHSIFYLLKGEYYPQSFQGSGLGWPMTSVYCLRVPVEIL